MRKIIAIKISELSYARKDSKIRANADSVWKVSLKSLKCGNTASVKLFNYSRNVEVKIQNYKISESLLASLKSKNLDDYEEFTKDEQNEICKLEKALGEADDKVLELIKYHLNYLEILEGLTIGGKSKWSEDGKCWNPLPQGVSVVTQTFRHCPLNSMIIGYIQKSLDNNILPLIAMRHLHRAKEELLPHHKWIDATIAAELAVKEVLIRVNPTLKTLLLDLPSPPLDKLYGQILEEYLGERSPFLSTIRKGVEVRNRLVHKPSDEKIDLKKAFDYVDTIEASIFHLLSLAYPENELIEYTAKRLY